ncbi:response regulator transcription factor [Shewanella sp. D64]|uniref:response regulator n=1 Tax=unclassified Shewanella TaxID=196818 RepID=UPI0022BA3146|nr:MULTISPECIES: response regulator transcription factor [unclassified Shewanella]MEC4728614.1 response regulator transcription factor [Shewanella sp. D64]MEC4737863.1 response regulator transcription factor [Shewanella sp. E94]WBJ93882.1 response regulator transcription factor [Shewanella sp. MTB7]
MTQTDIKKVDTPITIGLVDDQQLVRQGIASLLALSDKVNVLWQAEDGEDAIKQLGNQTIDLILSDIRMPNLDGIGMLKQIRDTGNTVPIIMLTTFDDDELLTNSITQGANGFLLKDVSLDKLIAAIVHVASGGFLIEQALLTAMANSSDSRLNIDNLTEITVSKRESEILILMASGFSNKEIASSVFLAEGTVKNHISNILLKLESRDRTQAVLKALQIGLI